MKKTNTLALALVCSLAFHNVRAETCAGIAYDLADIAQDLTDLLVTNEEILNSIGDEFHTLGKEFKRMEGRNVQIPRNYSKGIIETADTVWETSDSISSQSKDLIDAMRLLAYKVSKCKITIPHLFSTIRAFSHNLVKSRIY